LPVTIIYCRYGLNPKYEDLLNESALHIVGRHETGEARAVELANQPFFFATLFQPERSALRNESHPLITALVAAAIRAGDLLY
jgi:CTP synthase (UTP-ammonia lyase)